MALTEAGEAFYEGCAAMVAAARTAHERLADLQERPVGELRVSAPAQFAATHLATALAPFLAAHPALSLQLIVTDDTVDVIRERIDLAITISRPLRDSSLVRHHLADWALVLCASPKYLAKRGTPAAPHDLARHDLLALPAWHHPPDVLTGPEGQTSRVTIKPRVTSNNQFSIRQLTLMGLGLSFHAEPEVAEEDLGGSGAVWEGNRGAALGRVELVMKVAPHAARGALLDSDGRPKPEQEALEKSLKGGGLKVSWLSEPELENYWLEPQIVCAILEHLAAIGSGRQGGAKIKIPNLAKISAELAKHDVHTEKGSVILEAICALGSLQYSKVEGALAAVARLPADAPGRADALKEAVRKAFQ